MSLRLLQGEDRRRRGRGDRTLLPLLFGDDVVALRWRLLGALAAGLLVPGSVLVASRVLPGPKPSDLPPMEVVLTTPPAPKPVAPPPQPPLPEPEPARPMQPAPARPRAEAPPPGTKARAGKVLAVAPEPAAQPVAEGDAIVTGEADRYAGGATASTGKSEKAIEEVPQAPPATRPKPAVDIVALTRAYLGRIRELLAREKRYPLAAQRTGIEGTVVLAFVVEADGSFRQARIVASSGNDLLDEAAIETVHHIDRRLPRPKETGSVPLPIKTAIRFEIAR